jgi:hypothetical protein
MSKEIKDWTYYSEYCFRHLNFEKERYFKSAEDRKIIAGMVYHYVFTAGTFDSGLTTSQAHIAKKFTADHWLSPRKVCRAIMECAIYLLDDYEEFEKVFRLMMSTIRMTQKENGDAKFNIDREGVVSFTEHLETSYSNFKFMPRIDNEELGWYEGSYIKTKEFPLAHMIPDFYKEYESKYMLVE